ncbi:MAG: hypothetical protein AB4058_13700 [Microcystaceae cyanobacterium]
MTNLPQTTQHRLQKLPQMPSVWEGDRRPLSHLNETEMGDRPSEGECIIWVDGSEGFVRAMEIVSPETGLEAVVRTLIKAIENPHSPAQPARPQKIVVRNREIQFFLRGALQNLDIAIDYVPELPIIDELFRSFEAVNQSRPPALPPSTEPILRDLAATIWSCAPWEDLADYDIIAIHLNHSGIDTLYACVMGMMGQEYGVIFYRSIESLKQFRTAAITQEETDALEQAFLSQDCWFLNYEAQEFVDEDEDLADLDPDEIYPLFGSIHPYEGIRPFLDEEEGKTLCYVLEAFVNFMDDYREDLSEDPIPELKECYDINHKIDSKRTPTLSIEVSTLPDLANELLDMLDLGEDSPFSSPDNVKLSIRDDLIPDNAFLSLGMIPWSIIERLEERPKTYYQTSGINYPIEGEGMPVVLIQTSRPKAKEMIQTLQQSGGLKGICFNPGEDSMSDTHYDLGILQTENGDLFIFGEFLQDDPQHKEARKKWDHRCQMTEGCCGLIIAMGVTGSSKGNPQLSDMLAVFEAQSIDTKGLAMGVLQLMPMMDDI